MSTLKNSQSFETFSAIENQVQIALEAANDQLNFLFGISPTSDFFTLESLQDTTLKYQNQSTQMDILQQQCEHWLETEVLSQTQKTAIYQLEINGFKLHELTKKIIAKLNDFKANLESTKQLDSH